MSNLAAYKNEYTSQRPAFNYGETTRYAKPEFQFLKDFYHVSNNEKIL
jgi:hypothetical protein